MKLQTVLVALAVTASTQALAKPAVSARNDFALKDSHPVPEKWTRLHPAPKDAKVNLQIGLTQSQFEELERHLFEVSDPDHHRYGQHLSQEDVDELVKPHSDANELVHEWLREYGIETEHLSYSSAGDWIGVVLPVGDIERMLNTEYHVFEHKENGVQIIRTPEWSLPQHLHEHIEVIAPTNSFFYATPNAKFLGKRSSNLIPLEDQAGSLQTVPMAESVLKTEVAEAPISKVCNFSAVTPRCLRTLYKTIDYKPKAAGKNKVGLTNYLMETNNISDVNLFLKQYRPAARGFGNTIKFNIIQNGDNQQTPNTPAQNAAGKDLEGNLDAETIIGFDYPTPLIAYNTGGSPPFKPDKSTPTNTNEPYLAWTNYVLATKDKNLPSVISSSYGDDEQTVPKGYATRVCKHYAQIGARGVTLLYSSGDSGVGANGTCQSNDGKKKRIFLPTFSNSCPYVTSVGGTYGFPEKIAYDPGNGYVPGGGFSNYWARPKYQDAAVVPYVKTIPKAYKGLYNPKGRAYPDIAAQSQRFVVTWGGNNVLLDGTSAASPTAAGVLALVNDALIAAGKSPLGFMNPWLYKKGHKAFNDITKGAVTGCGTKGFSAATGWDAASGWGTPDFKAIRALLGV